MNLKDTVPLGLAGEASEAVTPDKTVRHRLADMPAVYTTPNMIYLMEVAATASITPLLPPGWISLGVGVDIRHLAATPVGATVTARSRVVQVTDRLVTFEVEAHDGRRLIGKGTHSRAPVELQAFLASVGN